MKMDNRQASLPLFIVYLTHGGKPRKEIGQQTGKLSGLTHWETVLVRPRNCEKFCLQK